MIRDHAETDFWFLQGCDSYTALMRTPVCKWRNWGYSALLCVTSCSRTKGHFQWNVQGNHHLLKALAWLEINFRVIISGACHSRTGGNCPRPDPKIKNFAKRGLFSSKNNITKRTLCNMDDSIPYISWMSYIFYRATWPLVIWIGIQGGGLADILRGTVHDTIWADRLVLVAYLL